MSDSGFDGFSRDALQFLRTLKDNNTREWFVDNKATYDREIKAAATVFCDVMTAALSRETGLPHRSKIFRIHRDVRFSKDKTPYNAHLHISFIPETQMASPPMWFFGLGTDTLALGTGVFAFDREPLDRFRARIVGKDGDQIARAIADVSATGARISEPALKRVPSGYPKDHPHEALLRHKGLSAWSDHASEDAMRADLMDWCMGELRKLRPIFDLMI